MVRFVSKKNNLFFSLRWSVLCVCICAYIISIMAENVLNRFSRPNTISQVFLAPHRTIRTSSRQMLSSRHRFVPSPSVLHLFLFFIGFVQIYITNRVQSLSLNCLESISQLDGKAFNLFRHLCEERRWWWRRNEYRCYQPLTRLHNNWLPL